MTKEELQLLAELEGVDLEAAEVPEPPKRAPMPMKPAAAAIAVDAPTPQQPRGTHGALAVTASARVVDGHRRDREFDQVIRRLRGSPSRRGI